jgi:broad specificity phosphatase PhoE/ribonuclease HI
VSRRLLVEADGGSRGNPGPAAYGALVRDADTLEVLAREAAALGVASNNVAEYSGLLAGLRLADALDPDSVIEVRMDSKLVVEQMSGRWKIKHDDMRRLAALARETVDPARVRYTWVPRERNKDADRLANEALDDAASGRPWRGAQPPPARLPDESGSGPAEQSAPTDASAGSAGPAGPADSGGLSAPAEADLTAPTGSGGTSAAPDAGEPTTLVLLRHGVTELTRERRFSGTGGADLPLTDLGRRQALAAVDAVRAAGGADAVVSSPLLRTRETAEVVARSLGLDVRVDAGWTEVAFGDWDGLTATEVAERWPAEHRAWLASTSVAPPGGDSLDELTRRVRLARDRLLARAPRRRVVVVTHASPIKAMVCDALGAPASAAWRLDSAPAAVTVVRWWADGGASVSAFNETGHLNAAGLPVR